MNTYFDKIINKVKCPSIICNNSFDSNIFGWTASNGQKYCSEQCANDHFMNSEEKEEFYNKWINSKMTISQRGHRSV